MGKKKCPMCAEEIQEEARKCPFCGAEFDEDKPPVEEEAVAEAAVPEPAPERKKRRWLKWVGIILLIVVVVGVASFAFAVYYWGFYIPDRERKEHAGKYVNPEGKYILLESNGNYRIGEYTPGYVSGEQWHVEGGDIIFVPTERTGRGGVYGYRYVIQGNSIIQATEVGDDWIPETDPRSVYTKVAEAPSTPNPFPQVTTPSQ